jgi:hypothetical protein
LSLSLCWCHTTLFLQVIPLVPCTLHLSHCLSRSCALVSLTRQQAPNGHRWLTVLFSNVSSA